MSPKLGRSPPVTTRDDMLAAGAVFGPDLRSVKGKTVQKMQRHLAGDHEGPLECDHLSRLN
jgi:hypothetical protein